MGASGQRVTPPLALSLQTLKEMDPTLTTRSEGVDELGVGRREGGWVEAQGSEAASSH